MKARRKFEDILALHRPTEAIEILEIYIPIRLIGKERPRGQRTPIKTRRFTDAVRMQVAEIMRELDMQPIDRSVCARYIVGYHEGRKPDIDNAEKALWDAFQSGDKEGKWAAIKDDKHIRGYVEKVEHTIPDNEEAYIWVRLYEQPAFSSER